MSSSIILVTLVGFIYAIENQHQLNLLIVLMSINITYVYKYLRQQNYTSEYMMKYILFGESLYAMAYAGWVIAVGKDTYVYFVPLYLSSMAKTVWLFTRKDLINMDMIEQVALFQTKCELFVLAYEIMAILYGGVNMLAEIFFLLVWLKLKYSFHAKTQQAYQELYFSIDNLLKRTKLRPKFQKLVHTLISMAGQVYGGSKDLIY